MAPLEGLWWAENLAEFSVDQKADWPWTMMIGQPAEVTPRRFAAVGAAVKRKKGLVGLDASGLSALTKVYLRRSLHIGPFSAEGPVIAKLHSFIRSPGCSFDGRKQKHHEIYLSDPQRTVRAKWRTVIRQPVAST